MTSEKLEYDSSLGGSEVLSDHISTYYYAGKHIEEMKELLQGVQNPCNTKLMFQSLPKHMRRRAMSHDPKRLPRKYRIIHNSQMVKGGNPQKTKRPSRKYRRKPSSLTKEYFRRQRKHTWLETHIWHAKRFHMINRWGYKLPFSSCDKTYRTCYRASVKHCLLQDISFYGCIEIRGTVEAIKIGFDRLTNSKCGLSITSTAYVSGTREGSLHLFKTDQYPKNALTKVNFFWKPLQNVLEETRVVWIFVHPSAYTEIIEELIKVFQLKSTRITKLPLTENTLDSFNQISEINQKNIKFLTKINTYIKTPQHLNTENQIVLTELKDTINRFRLTGPLSQSILFRVFKCVSLISHKQENWFGEYMQSDRYASSHQMQTEYWRRCSEINSPSELTPNIVLGLNVEDPRLNRPKRRIKAMSKALIKDNLIYYDLPKELCWNAIWDSDVRKKIANDKLSNNEYYKMRNHNTIIPGERCSFENEIQPIPILLIQRPGSQNNQYKKVGYGEGWDVILPSGYGLCVWLSMIMCGAKPGGLKEIDSVSLESGQDQYLPDSISGKKYYLEKYIKLRENYFRLPPNKRCNYTKLAICSPFRAPLNKLVSEWFSGGTKYNNDIYILRETEILQRIAKAMKTKCNFPDFQEEFLVQVSIKMKARGNPGDFSLICLPSKKDIKLFYKNEYRKINDPVYVEPLKKDACELERKILNIEHKKLLKRLKRSRVREKRKLQKNVENKAKTHPASTSSLVSKHCKKMCQLWLKDNPENVRYQCTKQVFGYVTKSEFCFTEAIVTGIGYVTVSGLKELVKIYDKGEQLVLIRGTKTRNYRFAFMQIHLSL